MFRAKSWVVFNLSHHELCIVRNLKKCGASLIEEIQNQEPTNCNNIYFT
jgi:hypothetical protein